MKKKRNVMKSVSSCRCCRVAGEVAVQPNLSLTPRRLYELSQKGIDVPVTDYVRPPEVKDLAPEDFSVRSEMRSEVDTNDVWNIQQTARRRVNALKRIAVVDSKEE